MRLCPITEPYYAMGNGSDEALLRCNLTDGTATNGYRHYAHSVLWVKLPQKNFEFWKQYFFFLHTGKVADYETQLKLDPWASAKK